MGDMGDTFNNWTNIKKLQKGESLLFNTKKLKESNLSVEFKNRGYHAVVEGTVDFWPSTSTWICRKTKKKHFGFDNMVKHLEKLND